MSDADSALLPEDRLPRAFGGYMLRKLLARGGMGEVFLASAEHIVGNEFVILKKLRRELTRDSEYVGRFSDEARVVVHLEHPYICRVLDVGKVDDEYFLAMEYVSGCDIRQIQDKCRHRQQPMKTDVALLIVAELLEALDYAHVRTDQEGEPLQLVHRDVSPQNVMISYSGTVKLIDFGLAQSRLKLEKTQPNVVMGKMAYMSPEQARGDAIDKRADLFAAGVIMYELLANERYYEGMGMNDIWNVVGRGGFVPRKFKRLPKSLTTILGRALHPELDKRYPSCAAFRRAVMAELKEMNPSCSGSDVRQEVARLFKQEIAREKAILQGFSHDLGPLRQNMEQSRAVTTTLAQADLTQVAPADLPTRTSYSEADATLIDDDPSFLDPSSLHGRTSLADDGEKTLIDPTEVVRSAAVEQAAGKKPIPLPVLLVAAMFVGMALMAFLILVFSLLAG